MSAMMEHVVVFGYGSRNADGSRILEFADGLNLVICNSLFTKQEAKLVTCVAGHPIFFPYGPGLTSMQHAASHTATVQPSSHNQ